MNTNNKKINIVADKLLSKLDKFSQVYDHNKTSLKGREYWDFVNSHRDNEPENDFVHQGMGDYGTVDIIGQNDKDQIEVSKEEAKQAIKYYIKLYLAMSTLEK